MRLSRRLGPLLTLVELLRVEVVTVLDRKGRSVRQITRRHPVAQQVPPVTQPRDQVSAQVRVVRRPRRSTWVLLRFLPEVRNLIDLIVLARHPCTGCGARHV